MSDTTRDLSDTSEAHPVAREAEGVPPGDVDRRASGAPASAASSALHQTPESLGATSAADEPKPLEAPGDEPADNSSDRASSGSVEFDGPATESEQESSGLYVMPAADSPDDAHVEPPTAASVAQPPAPRPVPPDIWEHQAAATPAAPAPTPRPEEQPAATTPPHQPRPASSDAPFDRARLYRAIEERLDRVVRLGQELVDTRLFGPRGHNGLLREAQLRNAVQMASETDSIEVVKNWLRYQTVRPEGRGWQHERFGLGLVEQIEGPLRDVAREAAGSVGEAHSEADALLRTTRLYLGYVDRHFTFRERDRQLGERRGPAPRPALPTAGPRPRPNQSPPGRGGRAPWSGVPTPGRPAAPAEPADLRQATAGPSAPDASSVPEASDAPIAAGPSPQAEAAPDQVAGTGGETHEGPETAPEPAGSGSGGPPGSTVADDGPPMPQEPATEVQQAEARRDV